MLSKNKTLKSICLDLASNSITNIEGLAEGIKNN